MPKIRSVTMFLSGAITSLVLNTYANSPGFSDIAQNQVAHFATALRIVKEEEQSAYTNQLSAIPDIIDCKQLTWLNKCDFVNSYYKQHPGSTVRIHDKHGFEHTFAPGTPSSFISLSMNPSIATARKHLDEFGIQKKYIDASQKIAAREIFSRGGLTGDLDGARSNTPMDIPTKGVNYYLMVDTESPYDAQIDHLVSLKIRHPDASITVYLAKGKDENFVSDVQKRGLKSRELKASERKRIQSMVSSYPTIWIDYGAPNTAPKRNELTRLHSVEMLERATLALVYSAKG